MKNCTSHSNFWSPSWVLLGLIALLVTFGNGDVTGQSLDRDRVKQEIEQTDAIIEQARKAVDQSHDQRAGATLRQAEDAQDRARQFLENGRLTMALQFTRRAREAASRCIGMMVRTDEDRSLVEQQLDRTDELLEQVRTVAQGSEAPAIDLRLQEAQRLQDHARDLFTENNLRQSLQFTRRAQSICRNLIERLSGVGQRREHFRLNIERAKELVADNREGIVACNNENARTLFEAGAEQVEKSEQMYQSNNYEEAVRFLAGGLSRIRRALQSCDGEQTEPDAGRALASAQLQIERLRERAQETGNRDADKLLDEAAGKLDQARRIHEQGDDQRTLVVLRVVIELNQKAAKILGAW